jgi:hypothetical protein
VGRAKNVLSEEVILAGCGSARCTCVVAAGPGVTVDGAGSTTNPYIISAGGGPVTCDQVRPCLSAGDGASYDPATGVIGARPSGDAGNTLVFGLDGGLLVPPSPPSGVTVTDTDTVDLTLAGTGAPGDPYDLSAAVVVDAAPPGGGGNLLHEGPGGLYVECGDVRGCLSGGDGIDVDPATGVISLDLSEQAGNAATIAGDGGLFVSSGAVSCDDVRPCLSAGPGATYDPATGVIGAQISGDAGNALTSGGDGGLFVPPGGAAVTVADSATVDMSGDGTAGTPLTAAVIRDPAAGNLLVTGPAGVSVPCEAVQDCVGQGFAEGLAYDDAANAFRARLSTDAGNNAAFGSDGGLYVPTGSASVTVADSPTVDLSGDGTGGNPITATVIRDPAAGNLLVTGPAGVAVSCEAVQDCVGAAFTDGLQYDDAANAFRARVDPAPGNTLTQGPNGLFVAPAAAGVAVSDTPCIDLAGDGTGATPLSATPILDSGPGQLLACTPTGLRAAVATGCGLTGDGTAAAPVQAAPMAGQQAWPWPCDGATHSTLRCDPGTGELWTPPEHDNVAARILTEHFASGLPPMGVTAGMVIIDPGADAFFTIPPNFLSPCRRYSWTADWTLNVDLSYTSGAAWEVGYAVSVNGAAATFYPMHGQLTSTGIASRERFTATFHRAGDAIPAATASSMTVWPAIRVISGQVTIHSWRTDMLVWAATARGF